MIKKKTIAVDFDGVLHWYRDGWKDGSIYDDPVPGAARGMRRLQLEGYRLVIFSTRAYPQNPFTGEQQGDQVEEMIAWLKRHGIAFDEIWTNPWKPAAEVFIDDRAYRFPPRRSLLRKFIDVCLRINASPWAEMERELESDRVILPESEHWPELHGMPPGYQVDEHKPGHA